MVRDVTAFVQDAGYENSVIGEKEEDDVAPILHSSEPRTHFPAISTNPRRGGKKAQEMFQSSNILSSLRFAPFILE